MDEKMMEETIQRIQYMEVYLNVLEEALSIDSNALKEDPTLQKLYQILVDYYESGQWLKDYELDEKGLIPNEIKRSVLAQDTLYNFLENNK